jgi:hypothetical protein
VPVEESETNSGIAGVFIEKDRMQFVAVGVEQTSSGGVGLAFAGEAEIAEEARKIASAIAIDLRTGTSSQSLFLISNSLGLNYRLWLFLYGFVVVAGVFLIAEFT